MTPPPAGSAHGHSPAPFPGGPPTPLLRVLGPTPRLDQRLLHTHPPTGHGLTWKGPPALSSLPWQAELVRLAGYLLATLSPKPWLSRTHPHTLVLRHSTGPRPQERGGTRFLGSPAGRSLNCIRSGRWPPRRSRCPASCRSGALALSCTAWRWFAAPLQGTGVLRGRPHPSRNGVRGWTHRGAGTGWGSERLWVLSLRTG